MEIAEILDWIDRRKLAIGIRSDRAVEAKADTPSAINNMRKTLRNGHGSTPKVETLRKLAAVLGEPPAVLLAAEVLATRAAIVAELRAKAAALETPQITYDFRKRPASITGGVSPFQHAFQIITIREANFAPESS